MWNRIREIIRKEFRQVLREPRMRVILIFPPLVQLIIFGYAVNLDVENCRIAWMDLDRTPASRDLQAAFVSSKRFLVTTELVRDEQVRDLLDHGEVQAVVRILPGFARDIQRGQTTAVQILVDGTNSNTASIVSSYATQIVGDYSGRAMVRQQQAKLVARTAAVGGPTDRMIRLRRRDNTQLARAIDLGVPSPLGVLWAPAGNRMYVPLTDKTVRVYDPNTGGHVVTLTGHTDWVYGAALAPDGTKLATASADGTVKLWHTGENRLLATLVQVTPRTEEWLIVAMPGYVAASSLKPIEWRAANLTTPPDKIPGVLQDPELVKKALAGEKVPPPAVK